MKGKAKVAADAEQKSIIQNAIQSSENEQLDLYKAIFGGSDDCNVASVGSLRTRLGATAEDVGYAQVSPFTLAAF